MMVSKGKRYQIIVLEAKRNCDNTITPLLQLKEYFAKQNNRYNIISFEYGRLNRTIQKTLSNLIITNELTQPTQTFYEITKTFIEQKIITPLNIEALAYKLTFEEFLQVLKGEYK